MENCLPPFRPAELPPNLVPLLAPLVVDAVGRAHKKIPRLTSQDGSSHFQEMLSISLLAGLDAPDGRLANLHLLGEFILTETRGLAPLANVSGAERSEPRWLLVTLRHGSVPSSRRIGGIALLQRLDIA